MLIHSSRYNTIKSELNSSRPVILSGYNVRDTFLGFPTRYEQGHEWVCDGYQETYSNGYGYLYFRMNWGWDGNRDGWYAFNNWTITFANGSTVHYQYYKRAIVGIRP